VQWAGRRGWLVVLWGEMIFDVCGIDCRAEFNNINNLISKFECLCRFDLLIAGCEIKRLGLRSALMVLNNQ
jgi:hypothetical protein